MKVQIIGGGAVGLLVASYLQQGGLQVTIVVRNEEQCESLNRNGLTRIGFNEEELTIPVTATTQLQGDARLTIVTTKSYQLTSLLSRLQKLPTDMALLFMQNGLAHFEPALQLPQQHIGFASVQFGAVRDSLTSVSHKGIGLFKLAVAKGDKRHFEVLEAVASEKFPVLFEEKAYDMLFEKALLNCFVNPMTAILQVKNGVLIQNPAAYKLLKQLYDELKLAFPREMEKFPFEAVVSLCEKTALNTSSMLMDMKCGRQSEVDAIVRPIIEKAERAGHLLPSLSTLYYLVNALEMERDRQK